MKNLFTVSTAEQPTDPRWLYSTPQKSIHAPDWSEGARTLFSYTITELQRAIAYLDLFDPFDDLAPPQPFDPRAPDWRDHFLCATGQHVAGYEPLTGWDAKADGLNIVLR